MFRPGHKLVGGSGKLDVLWFTMVLRDHVAVAVKWNAVAVKWNAVEPSC
jgi:hypothetical protein